MGKIKVLFFGILISLIFTSPSPVLAEKVAGHSASISYNITNNDESVNNFVKKLTIKRMLEKYNSPMVDSVDAFIKTCTTYNLDCYLLPSIAGLESYFGTFIYPGSNNAFGWGRGLIMFKDWAEGIETVGKGLRENYINKGADTIDKIGVIYCEGNTWAGKVNYFLNQFALEEGQIQLYLNQNAVQL